MALSACSAFEYCAVITFSCTVACLAPRGENARKKTWESTREKRQSCSEKRSRNAERRASRLLGVHDRRLSFFLEGEELLPGATQGQHGDTANAHREGLEVMFTRCWVTRWTREV
eukprot:6173710-Pleurochrysis_carterae.AAC.1